MNIEQLCRHVGNEDNDQNRYAAMLVAERMEDIGDPRAEHLRAILDASIWPASAHVHFRLIYFWKSKPEFPSWTLLGDFHRVDNFHNSGDYYHSAINALLDAASAPLRVCVGYQVDDRSQYPRAESHVAILDGDGRATQLCSLSPLNPLQVGKFTPSLRSPCNDCCSSMHTLGADWLIHETLSDTYWIYPRESFLTWFNSRATPRIRSRPE